jgi:serine/threonine protein kinase
MVLELMPGGSLYKRIRQKVKELGAGKEPFSRLAAVHIMLQVAKGMRYLHLSQVIHR